MIGVWDGERKRSRTENCFAPARKVARCLQIENKIRAVIEYDLAATVPLV
jgi:hypothetical protein